MRKEEKKRNGHLNQQTNVDNVEYLYIILVCAWFILKSLKSLSGASWNWTGPYTTCAHTIAKCFH